MNVLGRVGCGGSVATYRTLLFLSSCLRGDPLTTVFQVCSSSQLQSQLGRADYRDTSAWKRIEQLLRNYYCCPPSNPFTRRTDQTDHDPDRLDPNLPLYDIVQDLYRINSTQDLCHRSCRWYALTRQHEPDNSTQECIRSEKSRS